MVIEQNHSDLKTKYQDLWRRSQSTLNQSHKFYKNKDFSPSKYIKAQKNKFIAKEKSELNLGNLIPNFNINYDYPEANNEQGNTFNLSNNFDSIQENDFELRIRKRRRYWTPNNDLPPK